MYSKYSKGPCILKIVKLLEDSKGPCILKIVKLLKGVIFKMWYPNSNRAIVTENNDIVCIHIDLYLTDRFTHIHVCTYI